MPSSVIAAFTVTNGVLYVSNAQGSRNNKINEIDITHVNLNDKTVEGMAHRSMQAFSVQYHPEASPGPHDSYYLFEKFFKMMKENA